MNDNEFEIDQLLSESMRRRGASAQLGGGTIADVHRRVLRRRRRLVAGMATAVALPALIGVVALAGSRDHSGRVASPATNAQPEPTPTTVATPVPAIVCTIEVTSGTISASPDFGTFCDVGVPLPGAPPLPVAIGAGGWRCIGEPDKSEDGWSYYTTCEPVCPAIELAPPTTIAISDLPSTAVAVEPDAAATSTIELEASTTVAPPVGASNSTVVSAPSTLVVDVPVPSSVVSPAADAVSACIGAGGMTAEQQAELDRYMQLIERDGLGADLTTTIVD
jgi:hypothetical protein